jgi:hypothetical protein
MERRVKPRGLVAENGVTLHFENGRTRRSCTPWPAHAVVTSKDTLRRRVVMLRLLRGHKSEQPIPWPGSLRALRRYLVSDLTLRSLPAPERPYRRPSRYS